MNVVTSLSTVCCAGPFLIEGKKSFSWQHIDVFSANIHQIARVIYRRQFLASNELWREGSWLSDAINEQFLSVSVDLLLYQGNINTWLVKMFLASNILLDTSH